MMFAPAYDAHMSALLTHMQVGDRVGVGCMVNSCQSCDFCLKTKEEQYCGGCCYTYNGKDVDGSPTYGGYSAFMTVNEKFVLRIPDNLPMETAAPLLCAGITVYRWDAMHACTFMCAIWVWVQWQPCLQAHTSCLFEALACAAP